MRISSLEEYGLRCMLQLAKKPKEAISASTIAALEGMSIQYVSKILHLCRKAGLVSAERGAHGGFRLERKPHEISLMHVFQAVAGREEFGSAFCHRFSGTEEACVHTNDCSIRPVWSQLDLYFDEILKRINLADLCSEESTVQIKVEKLVQKQTETTIRRMKRG